MQGRSRYMRMHVLQIPQMRSRDHYYHHVAPIRSPIFFSKNGQRYIGGKTPTAKSQFPLKKQFRSTGVYVPS